MMHRRQFVAAVGCAALTASERIAVGQAEEPRSHEAPPPSTPKNEEGQTTILFFDDQRLNLRDRVTRHVGRPERIAESIYRDPQAHVGWGYPGVFRDEASGKWRMTYLAWAYGRQRTAALAESEDGLHWSPRDTTREIDLPDRILPNQVLPLDRFGEWPASFLDDRAPATERLKGLVVYHTSKNHCRTRLWVSPDGIHWKLKEGIEWQKVGPDPGTHVFWNHVRQSYTFTSRPDWTDRRIAVFETKDWKDFTAPELALQADALDLPLTEPYGMSVIPYHGWFIGLLWLFHTSPLVKGHSPHKFFDGHVDCQLAYSLNGWHWQRGLREPFIPNGPPGEPDCGCVYPSKTVVKEDGSLWIYASACTEEHGYKSPGTGSILTYRLRRDGFVYLQGGKPAGRIGSRALYWRGGEAELNAQCPGGGAVRAQVTDIDGKPLEGYGFDDCVPLAGDDTAWTPTWKSDKTLRQQAGRLLRLEVELADARLYAVRGDFEPLVAGQAWRFRDEGLVPELRLGF
jgi:hypothetical protein